MGFLHGVETFELQEGPIQVTEVKSAVIGLVGTAAQGEPGEMHICRSRDDVTEIFGASAVDYTLYRAFDAIFDHANTTVVAINVYDPEEHTTGVEEVIAADIIAAIPTFESALSRFGFFPKILVAPGWSHETGVGAELISTAGKCRAVALIDSVEGATPEEAVTAKGDFGDNRAIFCYPKIKIYDVDAEAEVTDWLSGRMAGLIAQVDKEKGYWHSPSNHVLQGVTGVERLLTYIPNNEDTELNYVNSQGIVSVLNFLGSGYRLWGNRTCAYPFETSPVDSFICWRRTADIIEESVEYFTLQFLDQPMFSRPENAAREMLVRVQESVQGFLDGLMGKGALVYGKIYLRLADNPVTELAGGHITYTYDFTPPVPAERVTYKAVANVNPLKDAFAAIIGG